MRQKTEKSSKEARDSVITVTSLSIKWRQMENYFCTNIYVQRASWHSTRVHKRPELDPIQYPRLLQSWDMAMTADWTLSRLQTQRVAMII